MRSDGVDAAVLTVSGFHYGLSGNTVKETLCSRWVEVMVTKVAFIGLGVMGRPMAGHLLRAGIDVATYRRRGRDDEAFRAVGGVVATSVQEAVGGAEAVVTMLPDGPDVREVLTGEHGAFAAMEPGAVAIDMSTIAPEVSVELSIEAARCGVESLDAPVSGGERGAIDGSLSIMVGGPSVAVEKAMPLLNLMGKTIVHVGSAGAGQTVKAANQLVVAGNIQLLAEAIVLLEAAGVDTTKALEVLGGGLAGSTVIARLGEKLRTREFGPGFRVDLHHKDLGIVADTARRLAVATPLGAVVTELMASVRARGGGELDHSALIALVDTMSGRDTLNVSQA